MNIVGRKVRTPKPITQKKQAQIGPPSMYADSTKRQASDSNASASNSGHPSASPGSDAGAIPSVLAQFQQQLLDHWQDCWDFGTRALQLQSGRPHVLVAWVKVLVNRQTLAEGVFHPIIELMSSGGQGIPPSARDVEQAISVPFLETLRSMDDVHKAIAAGQTVVYVDGASEAFSVDAAQVQGRSVTVSEGEPAIQGPQVAFVEQLDVNLGLVRRVFHDARLKVRAYSYGELSHTQVVLLYVDGVTKQSYIDEWERRAKNLNVDIVLESNRIQELVRDSPWSPFPLVETTERPDKVAAALAEGRIVVGVDGTPEFLIMPQLFSAMLTSAEDYYGSFMVSFPIRILRHAMFWLALTLPSIYISLLTYNQDLLPTPLLINLEAQHEGIPVPTFLEAVLMQFSFEALREAGVRLPRAVGQSVSIVGALVIGEAAVTAGLVSPGMVIVVSATGVASFTIPDYALVNAVRILQIGFFLSAGVLGLYGMVLFGIILILHMTSLRSLGVPYLAPVAPADPQALKDVFFRSPFWSMKRRPRAFEPQDLARSQTETPSPQRSGTDGSRK